MKQSDIYTEALTCLRSILLADHPEFQNWIDWLERDIQDWNQRREVAHHLRAYGGMEECLHDVEQAAYHPHKALNQAIAQHLMQGDLQENLDRL